MAVYIVYSEKFEMLTCQIIAVAVWFYPTLDSTWDIFRGLMGKGDVQSQRILIFWSSRRRLILTFGTKIGFPWFPWFSLNDSDADHPSIRPKFAQLGKKRLNNRNGLVLGLWSIDTFSAIIDCQDIFTYIAVTLPHRPFSSVFVSRMSEARRHMASAQSPKQHARAPQYSKPAYQCCPPY